MSDNTDRFRRKVDEIYSEIQRLEGFPETAREVEHLYTQLYFWQERLDREYGRSVAP